MHIGTNLLAALLCWSLVQSAHAQSGIQWSSRPDQAVARATESGVPVMFWITQRAQSNDDEINDLRDAQKDAFRDPVVLTITERYFVPCRVARNSRVLAEAEKLGLPKDIGLHIAVVSPDGVLIDQIDPEQIASAEALADRLAAASRTYRDAMYSEKLKATLTNPETSKTKVRSALRTIWQLRMYGADQDIVGLLSRSDLVPDERSRLYQLLAAFGTEPCVNALLDAAPTDAAAQSALNRADLAAIPALLDALPTADADPTPRQIAAYRAATSLVRTRNAKDEPFWTSATPDERARELDRVRTSGQAVFDSWHAREGRWR